MAKRVPAMLAAARVRKPRLDMRGRPMPFV